ncbi:pectate lyase [Brevundimonas sp.]|uniref:pectate lyase n=1 Tax=Brevundimonas sp. TaxID=1871086 RepID=UPI00286CD388|nr:pectate lyase [Brevundimonas sp.]
MTTLRARAGALLPILLGLAFAPTAQAEELRQNVPAQSLTVARIARLPEPQRDAWAAYLDRSHAQALLDRATLTAELPAGSTVPPPPLAVGGSQGNMPLDREDAWYGTPEARAVADAIVSFQTPAGGWSKNQDRRIARLPGQRYSNDAETMELNPQNFDAPVDRFWTFVGTLDNGATTTEMRFLAKVAGHYPGAEGDAWRASIIKGVRYLLNAQYPNGGWPQIWPVEGGFHDAVTFNDNAVAEAAMLLEDVVENENGFDFVPGDLKALAVDAVRHGVEVILAAQVRVDGELTAWPQQVDPLTLAPSSARNYEPQSIASGETTDILLFLMRQPDPSPAVQTAVRAAIAWLESKRLYDHSFEMTDDGRKLIERAGAGPLWSRNYDLVTGLPIFGDKNQMIYDDVNEISIGRRNGYSWWINSPQKALDAYVAWNAANPAQAGAPTT